MAAENKLLLSVCGLCFTLTLLGEAMGARLPDPLPVNCLFTRWSEWTPCDACINERRRSRGILAFGQFGGRACAGSLGEREHCTAPDACQPPPISSCAASQFQCDSGICIKKNLECNYDIDCEDQSDETCDEVRRKPCRTKELEANHHSRAAGYGINILGASPAQHPFFNDFFNGICKRMWDPTDRTEFRLPWNVAMLHYETVIENVVMSEIYKSSHELLNHVLRENTHSIEGGLSFNFGISPSLSIGAGEITAGVGAKLGVEASVEVGHETTDMVKTILESTDMKNKHFVTVSGKVEFATFRMRSRNLRVSDSVLEDVRSLPLQYEKSVYFDFLYQYGTHYTRYGKLGGEYKLVYVLNQDVLTRKDMTETALKECLTVDLKLGITASANFNLGAKIHYGPEINVGSGIDLGLSGHIKPRTCKNLVTATGDNTTNDATVARVIVVVKGGDADTTAAIQAKINREGTMDSDTYATWARSILKNPAVIDSEPELIYTLIPLDMPGANNRVANLKRAISEYVAEYNVCKCQPCHNGGTVMLVNGRCTCLCLLAFDDGVACQNFKAGEHNAQPRPNVAQVGNWGCWSGWGSCVSSERRRVRACNREGLQGAACPGPDAETGYCLGAAHTHNTPTPTDTYTEVETHRFY